MLINSNTSQYVDLMKRRAMGQLPEMGSAKRTLEILLEQNLLRSNGNSIIDVGAASCHYFRTFIDNDIKVETYAGIEEDESMVKAAKEAWSDVISKGQLSINLGLADKFNLKRKFDICICINAFMYFESPYKALRNMIKHTKNNLLIRGYFSETSYRILRSQTSAHNDRVKISEADSFDKEGNLLSYDYWTIYSRNYITNIVKEINHNASLEWIEDKNNFNSIQKEKELNIEKRGATTIVENLEVSFPIILPWEYLLISL